MSKPPKSKRLCVGCRDNFYNGNNPMGISECWSFKSSKVVRRWKLGWWTRPIESGAFCEVYTLDCHHAPGKYAMVKELHPEAVNPIRLLAVVVLALTVAGCADPYFNPATSKAISEREQLVEAQKQTALIERQTIALEKIAERCGQ